jgi:O-antigen biosynthesis protein
MQAPSATPRPSFGKRWKARDRQQTRRLQSSTDPAGPGEGKPLEALKIALICNAGAEYTTGNYFRDLFRRDGLEFAMFTPAEQGAIPDSFTVRFYVDDGTHYAIRPAKALKLLYLIDTHTSLPLDLRMAPLADVVFCAQFNAVEPLRKVHPAVHWLPLGCDPALHHKEDAKKVYDLGFVGGIADERRAQMLRVLGERYPNSFLGRAPRQRIGEIYSSSRIVVNFALDNDLNMRFFEGLCSGSLLMTDVIANEGMQRLLSDAPEPVCVLYRDLDSLLELIDYYLQHEAEREAIARAGLAFSRRHRYADRWNAVAAAIEGATRRELGWNDYFRHGARLAALRLTERLRGHAR